MTDRLYLIKSGWSDDLGGPWYCPAGAVLEGVLSFHPMLRRQLEIRYLDYPRPRPEVIKEVGEDLQSCPLLVLDGTFEWADAGTSSVTGKHYLQDEAIIPYLGARYGIALPHP